MICFTCGEKRRGQAANWVLQVETGRRSRAKQSEGQFLLEFARKSPALCNERTIGVNFRRDGVITVLCGDCLQRDKFIFYSARILSVGIRGQSSGNFVAGVLACTATQRIRADAVLVSMRRKVIQIVNQRILVGLNALSAYETEGKHNCCADENYS